MFRVKVIPLLSSHSGWSVYTLLSVERQVNQYTHTHSLTHSLTLSVFITLSHSLSQVLIKVDGVYPLSFSDSSGAVFT